MAQELVEYVDRVERADHQPRRFRQELECFARSSLAVEQLRSVEREGALIRARSAVAQAPPPSMSRSSAKPTRETADDVVARLEWQNH